MAFTSGICIARFRTRQQKSASSASARAIVGIAAVMSPIFSVALACAVAAEAWPFLVCLPITDYHSRRFRNAHLAMVNTKEPCMCNKCRGGSSHWLQTRNSHAKRYGILEDTLTDPPASMDTSLDLLEVASIGTIEFKTIDLQRIRELIRADHGYRRSDDSLCLDIRSFYHRNIGRPISEALMRDLLMTLGEYVAVPRTVDGLQPKKSRPRGEKSVVVVVVCGVCCIERFDDRTVFNCSVCSVCNRRMLHCKNMRCRATCLDRDSHAIRITCSKCGIGPSFPKSKSAFYVQSIHEVLETLFSNRSNALDLLEPFDDAGVLSWNGERSGPFQKDIDTNSFTLPLQDRSC